MLSLVGVIAFLGVTALGANYICPIQFYCTISGCRHHMFDIHLSTNDMVTNMGKLVISASDDTLEFSHAGYSVIDEIEFGDGDGDSDLNAFMNAVGRNYSACLHLGIFDINRDGYRGIANNFNMTPAICGGSSFGIVRFAYKGYKARDATRIEISSTLMHEAFHILGLDHQCGDLMASDSDDIDRIVTPCIKRQLFDSFNLTRLDVLPPRYRCLIQRQSNYSDRLLIRDTYKSYFTKESVSMAIPLMVVVGLLLILSLVTLPAMHAWFTSTPQEEPDPFDIMGTGL